MNKTIRIFGFILAVVSLSLGILVGEYPRLFVDISSALFVVIPSAGLMLSMFGWNAFFLPSSDLVYRRKIIDYWSRVTLLSAFIAVLCGFVNMLANLSDPKNIGPSLALIILSLLYTLLLRFFILEPLKSQTEGN